MARTNVKPPFWKVTSAEEKNTRTWIEKSLPIFFERAENFKKFKALLNEWQQLCKQGFDQTASDLTDNLVPDISFRQIELSYSKWASDPLYAVLCSHLHRCDCKEQQHAARLCLTSRGQIQSDSAAWFELLFSIQVEEVYPRWQQVGVQVSRYHSLPI